MAGLAAMAGHSWSLYLGFKGGRGISVGLGVMAMIAPLEFLLVLFILALAIIMKNVPLGVGIGMASSPFLAWLLKEPAPATAGCGALALLTFAKRLLANREPLREPKSEILLNRLLFDRDVRDREEWIKRLHSERR
jgi:glycerol-3-phosphate acyltransferase PlsY